MRQKIIIHGFPHCGTSILKSIIGHVEDVEEIQQETKIINKYTDKQFILCKWPFTLEAFFEKEYEDYIKIFIIRNPIFVFSSLNKRFNYNIPPNHSIDNYILTIKKFICHSANPHKNVYTIRYEDLFNNNFYNLKNVLTRVGIQYDNNIFDNTQYTNVICPGVKLNNKIPKNTEHEVFRTWQINQPFTLNNDISKVDLTDIQKQKIINNPYILKLYPDVGDYR